MVKPDYEIYSALRDKRQLSDYQVGKDTGIPHWQVGIGSRRGKEEGRKSRMQIVEALA